MYLNRQEAGRTQLRTSVQLGRTTIRDLAAEAYLPETVLEAFMVDTALGFETVLPIERALVAVTRPRERA
jgi:hypothetical protein